MGPRAWAGSRSYSPPWLPRQSPQPLAFLEGCLMPKAPWAHGRGCWFHPCDSQPSTNGFKLVDLHHDSLEGQSEACPYPQVSLGGDSTRECSLYLLVFVYCLAPQVCTVLLGWDHLLDKLLAPKSSPQGQLWGA